MVDRPVFIDIDGTLTMNPNRRRGAIVPHRLDLVKKLIDSGKQVVIWSAVGTLYAQEFTKRYNIKPTAAIGKPDFCVDDTPSIVPGRRLEVLTPEKFFLQIEQTLR